MICEHRSDVEKNNSTGRTRRRPSLQIGTSRVSAWRAGAWTHRRLCTLEGFFCMWSRVKWILTSGRSFSSTAVIYTRLRLHKKEIIRPTSSLRFPRRSRSNGSIGIAGVADACVSLWCTAEGDDTLLPVSRPPVKHKPDLRNSVMTFFPLFFFTTVVHPNL